MSGYEAWMRASLWLRDAGAPVLYGVVAWIAFETVWTRRVLMDLGLRVQWLENRLASEITPVKPILK